MWEQSRGGRNQNRRSPNAPSRAAQRRFVRAAAARPHSGITGISRLEYSVLNPSAQGGRQNTPVSTHCLPVCVRVRVSVCARRTSVCSGGCARHGPWSSDRQPPGGAGAPPAGGGPWSLPAPGRCPPRGARPSGDTRRSGGCAAAAAAGEERPPRARGAPPGGMTELGRAGSGTGSGSGVLHSPAPSAAEEAGRRWRCNNDPYSPASSVFVSQTRPFWLKDRLPGWYWSGYVIDVTSPT